MFRKLKALGVAVFATVALAATAVPPASAANYTASAYPTTITGTSAAGNETITTEAGTVECAGHFQSTLNESSSTLTVTPTYTGCKAFGFVNATVSMNGCDYSYGEPKETSAHIYTAVKAIICPAGKAIEITASTCKFTIGSQSPGGHIILIKTTIKFWFDKWHEIKNVTGISYTVVTDGFGCPFSGTGAKTGATSRQHNQVAVGSTNGANIHPG